MDNTEDPNGDLHDKTIEQEATMNPGEVPGDVAGSSSASANLGNRRSFIFSSPPASSDP